MFENDKKSKNIAATIQSYTISISLIFGGGWAAFEFYELNRKEISKVNLEIKQIEADLKSVINIDIIPSEVIIKKQKYLKLAVVLKNNGNKDGYLVFKDKPTIYITKIESVVNGIPIYGNMLKSFVFMPTNNGKLGAIPNALIRNGERKEYPFLLPINESGAYLIRFVAKVEEDDERLPKKNSKYNGEWSHQIIHVVYWINGIRAL